MKPITPTQVLADLIDQINLRLNELEKRIVKLEKK